MKIISFIATYQQQLIEQILRQKRTMVRAS